MPVTNHDVARMLGHVADLLQRTGADRFCVYAWRRAAVSVERAPAPMTSTDPARLRAIPGVGDRPAAAIEEIVSTGSLRSLAELRRRAPSPWRELARVEGIGPLRARRIAEALHIGSLDELLEAARAGRLRTVKGIGAGTEARVAAEIERLGTQPLRLHRGLAERSPARQDLTADDLRVASAAGARTAVSTDAHSPEEYELRRCGVDRVLRAWGSGGPATSRGAVVDSATPRRLMRHAAPARPQ